MSEIFATIYPTLKVLVLPPVCLFILAALGWLIGRFWPRTGRGVIWTAIVLLYLASTPLIGGNLLRSLQTSPPLTVEALTPDAGAIVVLSAGYYRDSPEYGGDTAGPLTMERLRYGAKLQRDLGLPVLVTGGNIREAEKSLADVMADALENEFHVPVRWREDRAHDTFQNAQFSAELLNAEGIDTIYLVTHAWHMPRALASFKAAGLNVVAAPTMIAGPFDPGISDFVPSASGLSATRFSLHEWIGRLWYDLRYY